MKRNIPRLISLYGSASELARVAEIHRTAVTRWGTNGWSIGDEIQIRILRDIANGRLDPQGQPIDIYEVAKYLGVRRCECCLKPINRTIRELLMDDCELAEAAE